jgi:hypothetical protein
MYCSVYIGPDNDDRYNPMPVASVFTCYEHDVMISCHDAHPLRF